MDCRPPRPSPDRSWSPARRAVALLSVLVAASPVGAAGEEPPDSPARRITLAVARVARENAALPPRAQAPGAPDGDRGATATAPAERLRGDALAERLVRAGAAAARAEIQRGTPPAEAARSLLLALGVSLDSTCLLQKQEISRLLLGKLETEEEARARAAWISGASLRGRRDALQHFAVAGALRALGGEALAWTISVQKETEDAMARDRGAGSGFSFADLTADRAGMEFAALLLAAESPEALAKLLERLRDGFRAKDFVPDLDRYLTDADEALGWKEFLARFGSLGDSRFAGRIRALREDVLRLPGLH